MLNICQENYNIWFRVPLVVMPHLPVPLAAAKPPAIPLAAGFFSACCVVFIIRLLRIRFLAVWNILQYRIKITYKQNSVVSINVKLLQI